MKVFIKYYLVSIYETTSWTLRAFKIFYFYRVAYMHRIYLAFSLVIVSAVFNNFETSELSVPVNPRSVYRNFENVLTSSFPPKSIKIESKLLKTPYIPFFIVPEAIHTLKFCLSQCFFFDCPKNGMLESLHCFFYFCFVFWFFLPVQKCHFVVCCL